MLWAHIGDVPGAAMSYEPDFDGVTVFACGLLRDHIGRVLIVQLATAAHLSPSWWLPGTAVPSHGGAVEALRIFLTHELGLRRPEIRGQQFLSCDPSPGEPGGQFMLLFDCGTIRDEQLDRRRLHGGGAVVLDARWVTVEQARALLVPAEFHALARALQHQPRGLCWHLPASTGNLQPASDSPGAMPPRSGQTESPSRQSASADVVMPGISYDLDPRPALPRRHHKTPGSPGDSARPMDWFRSSDQQ